MSAFAVIRKNNWQLKEGKQVVTKNHFLDTSLDQFTHFSHGTALFLGNLGSDTMVTTCRDSIQDPNDFRRCKGSQLTKLLWKCVSSPKRTDRREGNTGAMWCQGEASLGQQAIGVWTTWSWQSIWTCQNMQKGIKSYLRQVCHKLVKFCLSMPLWYRHLFSGTYTFLILSIK